MKNPIKAWMQRRRNRKEQKRHLQELETTARQHRTLIKLQQAGLLTWNEQTRQLFIAEPLALVMMRSAETWKAFMTNVYLYEHYRLASAAWERHFQQEELKAVREAMKQKPDMKREECDRIRRACRQQIAETEVEPPQVEAFDFFIVRETTDAEAQTIGVGHFDPETGEMDMATWQEVNMLLAQAKTADSQREKK